MFLWFFIILGVALVHTSLSVAILTTPNDNGNVMASRTESALMPQGSPKTPVDPTLHSDWAGAMDPSDCRHAISVLKGRLAIEDIARKTRFWSPDWQGRPQGRNSKLPVSGKFGKPRSERHVHRDAQLHLLRLGSCTILLRMGRDYPNSLLPTHDGFVNTDGYPSAVDSTWGNLYFSIESLFLDVRSSGWPAYTFGSGVGGRFIVIMFIPTLSRIARQWAPRFEIDLLTRPVPATNETS